MKGLRCKLTEILAFIFKMKINIRGLMCVFYVVNVPNLFILSVASFLGFRTIRKKKNILSDNVN